MNAKPCCLLGAEGAHLYRGICHEGGESGLPFCLPKEGGIRHDRAVPHRGMDLGPATELPCVKPVSGPISGYILACHVAITVCD